MNPNTPELVALRKKATAGTLTFEEMKGAIELMRESRRTAHVVSAKSKTAKSQTQKVIDTGKLLEDLFQ